MMEGRVMAGHSQRAEEVHRVAQCRCNVFICVCSLAVLEVRTETGRQRPYLSDYISKEWLSGP